MKNSCETLNHTQTDVTFQLIRELSKALASIGSTKDQTTCFSLYPYHRIRSPSHYFGINLIISREENNYCVDSENIEFEILANVNLEDTEVKDSEYLLSDLYDALTLEQFNAVYDRFQSILYTCFRNRSDVKLIEGPRIIRCNVCKHVSHLESCPRCKFEDSFRFTDKPNTKSNEKEKAVRKSIERFSLDLVKLGFVTEFHIDKPPSNIRLDFYNEKYAICIELDGEYHFSAKKSRHDRSRDRWLFAEHGITTLRFSNEDLYPKYKESLDEVELILDRRS